MQTNAITVNTKYTLAKAIKQYAPNCRVFMCIGTQKVQADSLGPKVGERLNQNMTAPIYVYGVDQSNITAENLVQCYQFIKSLHKNEQIMVIDAGVGEKHQVGNIQFVTRGICPGSATAKMLPRVGDTGIIGIVGDKSLKDFYSSSTQKATMLENMTDFIAQGIILATDAQ